MAPPDTYHQPSSNPNYGQRENRPYLYSQSDLKTQQLVVPQQRDIRVPVTPRKSHTRMSSPHSFHAPRTPESNGPSPVPINIQGAHIALVKAKERAGLSSASPLYTSNMHCDQPDGKSTQDSNSRSLKSHSALSAAEVTSLMRSNSYRNATDQDKTKMLISLYDKNATTVIDFKSAGLPSTPQKSLKAEAGPPITPQSLYGDGSSRLMQKNVGNGYQNTPDTPSSRGMKRKRTPPPSAGMSRPSETGVTPELCKLSLAESASLNLSAALERESLSPLKHRRTGPATRQTTPDINRYPAPPILLSNAADIRGSSKIRGNDALNHDENNVRPSFVQHNRGNGLGDLQDPFTIPHDSPSGPRYNSAHQPCVIPHPITQPSPRKLVPYERRPPAMLAQEVHICEALVRPLTKPEMGIAWMKSSSGIWKQQTTHTGWMYIYKIANEASNIKIGITQVSIEGRLDSWTEQCGHQTEMVYPTTEAERQPVPNIYRLEALVQAELAPSRLEVECSCGKKHNEWFEVDLAHAKRVVEKWSEWMRTYPYEEVRPEPKSWHLALQYIAKLATLSRPLSRDLATGSASDPISI